MPTVSLQVVLNKSALRPTPVFWKPVVLALSALEPKAVLRWPVVLLNSAMSPKAALKLPVVLNKSAAAPTAVFWTPSPVLWSPTLNRSVPAPTAVLKLPSVLLKSEYQPNAAFATPVVMLKRAWSPSAVLNPGRAVSGAAGAFSGLACALDKSARQANANTAKAGYVILVIFFMWLFPFIFFLQDLPTEVWKNLPEWGRILTLGGHCIRIGTRRRAAYRGKAPIFGTN